MTQPKARPNIQKAVALFYDGQGAPQVTAKGIGEEAQAIIDLAQASGVPLCDNPALVELLSQIELGDQVPDTLFIAISHILAFAYQLRAPKISEPLTQPLNPFY